MKNNIITIILLGLFSVSNAQVKILFDATKAESAGNADWVIDADKFNLSYSNATPVAVTNPNYIGSANAQKTPTPSMSTITSSTPETYWTGGISNWAIDCVKQGYFVETLPFNGKITFGDKTNTQDLSNYSIYVIVEPNILFTLSEKDAILNFVKNGGSLCVFADHNLSDRNNDTYDAPHILNDFMATNSIVSNPFGVTFDYVDISQTSSNVLKTTNPIISGSNGTVAKVQWSGGTTMTIDNSKNATTKGVAFKTGASTAGTTNVLVAYSIFGSGKVVLIGDSSIVDDGTGDSTDVLYNGYTGDASGNHQILLMNTMNWLATPNLATETFEQQATNFSIRPNPIQNNEIQLKVKEIKSDNFNVSIYDFTGKELISYSNLNPTNNEIITLSIPELPIGTYFCTLKSNGSTSTIKFIKE